VKEREEENLRFGEEKKGESEQKKEKEERHWQPSRGRKIKEKGLGF